MTISQLDNLGDLQKWFQEKITDLGAFDSDAAAVSSDHITAWGNDIDGVVTATNSMSAMARLAIYSRSYWLRQVRCFQLQFPCLLQALGTDLFRRFVLDYLKACPSTSYTLGHLADKFPHHLASTRPDDCGEWSDFILELAQLELACYQVYEGRGSEQCRTLTVQEIESKAISEIAAAGFVPAPCLRLLATRYPVAEYLLAVRRGETPAMPTPEESWIALNRQDYVVQIHILSKAQYDVLVGISGAPVLGIAPQVGMSAGDIFGARDSKEIRIWLAEWAAAGFFWG